MEDLNVADKLHNAGSWLANNQQLLIHYAVNIVAAIIILILGTLIAKVISGGINKVMKARHIDITVADFLSAIIRYAIVIFTVIAALGRIGVQTASVIAVIGAAGLAVGLALQGSLSNFAAGVLLVTFRHFRAGEYVDFAGTSGTVVVVQIFSTTLRTYDGKMIVVPNSKILSGNITNFAREPDRLIDLTIGVSYDADIELVKKLLGDIIAADSRVHQDKGITVRLNALGASSMDFMVRAWVARGDLQVTTFDLLESFKRVLDENHIGIPYPQMDVHMYRAPRPAQENAAAASRAPEAGEHAAAKATADRQQDASRDAGVATSGGQSDSPDAQANNDNATAPNK